MSYSEGFIEMKRLVLLIASSIKSMLFSSATRQRMKDESVYNLVRWKTDVSCTYSPPFDACPPKFSLFIDLSVFIENFTCCRFFSLAT